MFSFHSYLQQLYHSDSFYLLLYHFFSTFICLKMRRRVSLNHVCECIRIAWNHIRFSKEIYCSYLILSQGPSHISLHSLQLFSNTRYFSTTNKYNRSKIFVNFLPKHLHTKNINLLTFLPLLPTHIFHCHMKVI